MTKKSTGNKVIVAGVGMIPFAKPGASETYDIMGAKAAKLALRDSGVDYKSIQSAFVGYVFGDSTSGQRALYHVGMIQSPLTRCGISKYISNKGTLDIFIVYTTVSEC